MNFQEDPYVFTISEKAAGRLKGQSKQTSLSRSLSAFDLVLLGIGCVVGTGIFVITGTVAATGAGSALILSFVLAALPARSPRFVMRNFLLPFRFQAAYIRIHMSLSGSVSRF